MIGEICATLYAVDPAEIENTKKFWGNGLEEVRGSGIKCTCGWVGL